MGTLSNEAAQNAGAFLIKAMELQQAIEKSTRDYKLFWAWLTSELVRLLELPVPSDMKVLSQQDIIYLANFLSTFDTIDEEGTVYFFELFILWCMVEHCYSLFLLLKA